MLAQSSANLRAQYLPSEAGRQVSSLTDDAHSLSPPGAVLFVGCCAIVLAIAAVLLLRRDT